MSDPLSRGEFIQVSAAAGAAGSAASGGASSPRAGRPRR